MSGGAGLGRHKWFLCQSFDKEESRRKQATCSGTLYLLIFVLNLVAGMDIEEQQAMGAVNIVHE